MIYHDLSLIERILRDQVSSNFSSIWVDSEADYERIVRFLNRFSPTLVRRVKLYTKETPLFEQFGIQDEISKALRSKVWLKSGGSIVINQTEALVAIDINTGKYVGKSARLEDTIVQDQPRRGSRNRAADPAARPWAASSLSTSSIWMSARIASRSWQLLKKLSKTTALPLKCCNSTISVWWRLPASASSSPWNAP